MAIVVSTLSSFIATDHELTLHCGDCQHHLTMDLPDLIKQFGPDYVVVANRDAFLSYFKCGRCGSKSLTVTVAYRYAGRRSEMARGG